MNPHLHDTVHSELELLRRNQTLWHVHTAPVVANGMPCASGTNAPQLLANASHMQTLIFGSLSSHVTCPPLMRAVAQTAASQK